jgi:tetratricopeptide (TPR) repeat protein
VGVPQCAVRTFVAEQTLGTVRVTVTDGSGVGAGGAAHPLRYANLAGLDARIRILLGADSGGGWTLTVDNPSSKISAVAIEVGASQPADARSAREQEAEQALATGEMLRAQKTSPGAEGLAAYDKAIALWQELGDAADVGRALSWKAIFLYLHENDPQAALPLTVRATQLTGSMEPVEAGNCWKTAAFINAQQTHYDAAREDYQRALGYFTKTGDFFNQEVLLDNLSRVERMEGNKAAALSDDSQAEALAEKIGDARGELGIEEEIGSIHTSSGDLEPAYDAFERALTLLQAAPSPYMEGYVWSDMGVLYTLLGDFGRAHDALDHAAAVWKDSHNTIGAMETLDDTGDLLAAEGKPEAARRSYQQGLEMADKSGSDRYRIFFLRGIGNSYLFEKDDAPAETNLREALNLATRAKEGDSLGPIHCALGDIALHRHDDAEARREYGECAAAATQDPMLKIRADGGQARVAYEQGDLAGAESRCEEALAGIEGQRGSLSGLDLRTSYFASMHAYYDFDIEILARLDRAHPGEGYQWKAFLAAERGRARTLLDEVAASGGSSFPGAASPLQGEHDDVLRRLRAVESATANVPAEKVSIAEQAAIARLTVEEHSLHAEIVAANQAGDTTAAAAPLTLKGIQDALPGRHSALIEYWTGGGASYVWGISASGVRMLRLPPYAELDRQITALRRAILAEVSWPPTVTAEQRAQLLPAARRRTKILAASLARTLFPAGLVPDGASTLLVVGDGPVLSVPFAALPRRLADASRGERSGPVVFLSEPSTAIFSYLEAHPVAPRPMRIAVFADEGPGAGLRSNGELEKTGLAGSRSASAELPALPFATSEAGMIRSIFSASATRIFAGQSATPEAIRTLDWNDYNIGHFAMHAVLNHHYAELNGLATGAPGSGGREMLWYGDVCRLHARLDLVVLSACDTALGETVPGEGLEGLTQAFFAAGSQRVLGTLWPVDDEATSEWMRDFYLALRATQSPTRALAMAQLAMEKTAEWSAPYYWAGFTLAGDWRPLPH